MPRPICRKYFGITLCKEKKVKVWRVRVANINGTRESLGYFATDKEAARAYDEAMVLRAGSTAVTNNPITELPR
eukprot:gene6237-2857_t